MFSKRVGETRFGYEEDIDIVEKNTVKVISVENPHKPQPHKVIINMDNPIPKYNHGINFYK